ncbi:hypothetical protein MPER_12567 [Moniliophthora perniciosa FA553]|nr:hypothetical protein MPER_12567 [Moniliophthora perniciosa FA553]
MMSPQLTFVTDEDKAEQIYQKLTLPTLSDTQVKRLNQSPEISHSIATRECARQLWARAVRAVREDGGHADPVERLLKKYHGQNKCSLAGAASFNRYEIPDAILDMARDQFPEDIGRSQGGETGEDRDD